MDEFRPALLHTEDTPLPLDGALRTIDTTDFASVQYDALLDFLRMADDGATGHAQTS